MALSAAEGHAAALRAIASAVASPLSALPADEQLRARCGWLWVPPRQQSSGAAETSWPMQLRRGSCGGKRLADGASRSGAVLVRLLDLGLVPSQTEEATPVPAPRPIFTPVPITAPKPIPSFTPMPMAAPPHTPMTGPAPAPMPTLAARAPAPPPTHRPPHPTPHAAAHAATPL
eukprot:6189803-Pleurochrysis_carterae.AAC.2